MFPPGAFLPRIALYLLICLVLLVCPYGRAENGNDAPPNGSSARLNRSPVLVLVTRTPADLWSTAQVDGILQEFRTNRPSIVPHVEYMDWQGGSPIEQESQLVNYYRSKYADRPVSTIIALDQPALSFLLRNRDHLFPNAEAIVCGIQRLAESDQRTWLAAILEQDDAPGTFSLARRLQPKLAHFWIIDDRMGLGAAALQRIEANLPDDARNVRFELIDGENMQAMFSAVEDLPANSAVLLARSRLARRALETLSQRCSAPLYGLRSPIHIPGVIGGSLNDGEAMGVTAAQIAFRILDGERANAIPIVTSIPHRLLVDYDELRRHNLPLSAVPAGFEVLNQPPSFWRKHSTVILAAGALILLLGAALFVVFRLFRKNRATAIQLSESLSTLNATFDSTADGLMVIDMDGRVSSCNERFLELWRVPREIADRHNDDAFLRHVVIQLRDPGAFLARIRDLSAKSESTSQGELLEFKDGRIFERDSRPLRQGNLTVGRVWSFRDVTARIRADEEQRRMGDQLAHTQKMEALGNLAGGIAHDFNNILTGVIGYVELAKARLPARHPAADDLDHVLRASTRAKDLVRQILTFSRKRAPEKRAIQLEPVIRDTLKLLRAVVPATIQIRADLSPSAGTVLADPTQVHQAVLNLATNAVHAIGQGSGNITVSLQPFDVLPDFAVMHPPLRPGPHVCLSVSDTGHGMDAGTLKRIFEPFFTTKAPGEGTGLGLAVVHAVVQGHDGALSVESEMRLGSSFRIYLPLARESQITPIPEAENTPEGAGERVLVVDDEAMITEVCRCYLESLGYAVEVAHSPDQALAIFSADPNGFAMLLTDFNMPHMNGLELVRRLRAIRTDLPALLCTGYVGSAATENEATSLGLDILGKPFTRHTLGLAIRRALTTPVPNTR
jgi:two-component system, cell cycle sensor histidine kinase and response regulator CckA